MSFQQQDRLQGLQQHQQQQGSQQHPGLQQQQDRLQQQSESYQSEIPVDNDYDETVLQPDYALLSYQFFSIYTCVSLSLLAFFGVIMTGNTIVRTQNVFDVLLQMYTPVLCICAFLAEGEITESARSMELLHSWLFRGFSYIFLGTLVKVECNYSRAVVAAINLELVANILTWNMLVIGVLYVLMGVMDAKKIKDRKIAKYIQLLSRYEMEQFQENFRDNRSRFQRL